MVSAVKELDLISKIREHAPQAGGDLIRGIGDDCSVFGDSDNGWLISTDLLVDAVHFERSWHPAYSLGRKCIAVNLSDIAAMGGDPKFVLISVCLTKEITSEWISSWYEGVLDILNEYNCLLIGGDTVSGKELSFSITVLGRAHGEGPIYRSGAKAGDAVYVSGGLGSAAAGLELFKYNRRETEKIDLDYYLPVITSHLNPTPQVVLGKLLAESGMVTAMQDVSDGIATDLGHIAKESKVKVELQEERLPIAAELVEISEKLGVNSIDLALRGGEDYQLVFTVDSNQVSTFNKLISSWDVTEVNQIGSIVKGEGVFIERRSGEITEISFSGYQHT